MYIRYDIFLRTSTVEQNERDEELTQQKMEMEKEKEKEEEKEKEKEADGGVVKKLTIRVDSVEDSHHLVSLTKEEVLRNILDHLQAQDRVFGESWTGVDGGKRWKVSFSVLADDADNIDMELRELGFGVKGSNTVMIVTKEEFSDGYPFKWMEKEKAPLQKNFIDAMKMTTGSLTVRTVLENIKQKAQVTPECIIQLFSASILSGLGLALNSTLYIVASMFLAPFMEAMNLLIFGLRLRERPVVWMALRILSLYTGVVLASGFVLGFTMVGYVVVYNAYHVTEPTDVRVLPTFEMYTRTTYEALLLGFVVSSVSALSTYTSIVNPRSDNVHVGNAISLSLVPPLTNSGMYIAIAIIYVCDKARASLDSRCSAAWNMCGNSSLMNGTEFTAAVDGCMRESVLMKTFLNAKRDMKEDYMCHIGSDIITRSAFSFMVTVINVIMLIVVGSVMLWLARFDPIKLGPKHVHAFHKYDIDYYNQTKTIKKRDPSTAGEYLEALRRQMSEKTHVPERDVDVMVETAQRSVHFQSIVGANRQQEVPLLNGTGFSNTVGGVRSRPRSRLMSDNQRTIRDTILSWDFDPEPRVVHRRQANRQSANSEREPLRHNNNEPESVGRFHVTPAPASPEP